MIKKYNLADVKSSPKDFQAVKTTLEKTIRISRASNISEEETAENILTYLAAYELTFAPPSK